MKKRVHWLAAAIIVVVSGGAIVVGLPLWLGLPEGDFAFHLVVIGLVWGTVLALTLAPLYASAIRGTFKCLRWQPGTIISIILLLLVTCMWVRSLWYVDSVRFPMQQGKGLRIASGLGRCSVGTEVDRGGATDRRTPLRLVERSVAYKTGIHVDSLGP